jgi:hypothetical protein
VKRSAAGVGALAGAALVVGCFSYRLPPEDAASARDGAELALRVYTMVDAATLPAAFSRAAFCADNAILERNDAGAVDAGALVTCHPRPVPKPPPMPTTCLAGFTCTAGHCVCEWDLDAGARP